VVLVLAAIAMAVGYAAQKPRVEQPHPGVRLGRLHIGAPAVFGDLALFPITSRFQQRIGPVTSLDQALERGTVEVRELDVSLRDGQQIVVTDQGAHDNQEGSPDPADDAYPDRRARVGTVAIDNRGPVPVYILAGTVVRGGKQDRQIARDVLVAAGQTLPLDAFCVEQGRWHNQRKGVATEGKFIAAKHLANSKVRAAGQFEGSQREVWRQAAEFGMVARVESESGTLLDSLDDKAVARQRDAMVAKMAAFLDSIEPPDAVVGFAWAVRGELMGVRWFVNEQVFTLFRDQLLAASALDAIAAPSSEPPQSAPSVDPQKVRAFVAEVAWLPAQTRRHPSGIAVVERTDSQRAYASRTLLKRAGEPEAVVVAADYVAKL